MVSKRKSIIWTTMKTLLLCAALLACCGLAKGQSTTVTLQPPTPLGIKNLTFTWTAPVAANGYLGCAASVTSTTTTCSYKLYRIPGVCPTTLVGSSGWTQVLSTAASQTTGVDTSAALGTLYSWVVVALDVASSNNSGPSNCVTYTTPAGFVVPNFPTGLAD